MTAPRLAIVWIEHNGKRLPRLHRALDDIERDSSLLSPGTQILDGSDYNDELVLSFGLRERGFRWGSGRHLHPTMPARSKEQHGDSANKNYEQLLHPTHPTVFRQIRLTPQTRLRVPYETPANPGGGSRRHAPTGLSHVVMRPEGTSALAAPRACGRFPQCRHPASVFVPARRDCAGQVAEASSVAEALPDSSAGKLLSGDVRTAPSPGMHMLPGSAGIRNGSTPGFAHRATEWGRRRVR